MDRVANRFLTRQVNPAVARMHLAMPELWQQ
jgi:hypothetical protein